MTTAKNKNRHSEEGRKILYRLLLLAVAVVYALVFVLDYMLQLHFTFYLLLSLVSFVILTLLYMTWRVWNLSLNTKKNNQEALEIEEEEKQKQEQLPLAGSSVFDDVIFIVNSANGLTIDCSPAAVSMFEAGNKQQLLGIDLNNLFDQSWKTEERTAIKDGLRIAGKANVNGIFRTLKNRTFTADLHAIRQIVANAQYVHVRITPSKEKITEVRESPVVHEWFDDAAFPMAFVGLNYGIQKANSAFCHLTGYTREELNKMTIIDLLHPEDRLQERKILSALFRGDVAANRREKRMIRRNNEVIWVNAFASVSKDQEGHPKFIITMAENITQKKRAEKILETNKSKLTSLVENAEYSTLTVDRRHTIMLINSKLSDILFTQTGIIVETGFNLLDILPETFHKEYLEMHKRAFEGEQFVVEKSFTINGRRSVIEVVITPVKEENGFVNTISIFGHDITAKKISEDELIREKDEALASTEAKSGFLATMSHEIRTPLNGVIGMGRLLSQTPLTPKQQEFVDSILLSSDALLSVINDILDFSKIESSKMELEYKPFAIKRVIEETFDLMSSKAIEKNLALHFTIERDVPSFVYGDITRLRQILMNLVSNAIKFTPKGIISIGVSLSQVTGGKTELKFVVHDTGLGIPPDKIGKLFKSYSQADAATAKTFGGTGLGLAICKNLVELMGGRIWVESIVGQGSDFIFTIKTEPVPKEEIPKGQRNGTSKLANSYVLIISDDKTEAAMYADYFRRWGMIPQVSDDPPHAMDVIRQRNDYNLVLIDAQLNSIKSTLLAQEIRHIRQKEELPIVMFNAAKTDEMFFDYTSEVVSAVIPKNIDRSKVLDILISVFSVEEHQRTRDDHGISGIGEKVGKEIPANILIAEDNLINQKLAQNIFEGLGYKPVIVSNGLEVIDQLRKKEFDIIFMDVQMPEMDGFEATRFILHKLQIPKKPVIVAMTAFALEGDKQKCIDAGMNDYISKPFLIEEIVERIRKWVPVKVNEKAEQIKSGSSGNTENGKTMAKTLDILNLNTVSRLRKMMGESDPTFFKQVMQMFISQADEQIGLIKNAASSNNLSEIGSLAHKLKGSALNIGADAMAETCRIIELNARGLDGGDMVLLSQRLEKEYAVTKTEILNLN